VARTTLITFDQNGGMKVDQQGFVGTQCEEATKALIGNIGAEAKREVKKPEYNQRAATKASAQQRW
jgi:hypothetical protein